VTKTLLMATEHWRRILLAREAYEQQSHLEQIDNNPRNLGGQVVMCCGACHTSKDAKKLHEWSSLLNS
jgi:hypothetical protein